MKMTGLTLQIIKEKIAALFSRNTDYEEFQIPNPPDDSNIPYASTGGLPGGPSIDIPSPERPPLRHIDKYVRPEIPCLSKRYTMATLTCVGFIISFGMKCNLGFAKLQFEGHDNMTSPTVKHINWTVAQESAVDSSFFWGYLITQVPGGFLSSRYPANRIFGTAIACTSFLHLFVPTAIKLNPGSVILVRICQGLVEGVCYPAVHGIWRFWAPPLERSRLATIAFCGTYAGIVLGLPISAILTEHFSWEAMFYFYGCMGMVWYVCWLWLSFEKPCLHPTISGRELLYIEKSLGSSVQIAMPTLATTPWREFAHSMPVYAIIVANFCRSWNFYLLVLFQASYLKSTFHLQIQETGFIGCLPHLLMTIVVPCGGLLADHLRKKGILSTTMVRKLFNCGGFGMEAFFFVVVAYTKSEVTATMALCFGVAFSGFAISGYNVNHLDIAPRYASILMGMSNGIGTIAGLICPVVIDFIIRSKIEGRWTVVFLIAATVHFIGITFYAFFASGELQPWAEPTNEEVQSWNPMEQLQPSEQKDEKYAIQNYGSTESGEAPYSNYSNHIVAQPVQPPTQDTYMNQDRNIVEEPRNEYNPFKTASTNPFAK